MIQTQTLPAPVKKPYEPPKVRWEYAFNALAQVSQPPCIPGQDPRCTP